MAYFFSKECIMTKTKFVFMLLSCLFFQSHLLRASAFISPDSAASSPDNRVDIPAIEDQQSCSPKELAEVSASVRRRSLSLSKSDSELCKQFCPIRNAFPSRREKEQKFSQRLSKRIKSFIATYHVSLSQSSDQLQSLLSDISVCEYPHLLKPTKDRLSPRSILEVETLAEKTYMSNIECMFDFDDFETTQPGYSEKSDLTKIIERISRAMDQRAIELDRLREEENRIRQDLDASHADEEEGIWF